MGLPLTVLLTVISVINSLGQGTIEFNNFNPAAGVNAPVYESDGVTKLEGPQFMTELLLGLSPTSLAQIATTGFQTGNAGGYFDGGTQTINGIDRGVSVWVQVEVWNTASGASFTAAHASGLPNSWWASPTFSEVLGGGGVNPSLPAPLSGLGALPVYLNGAVPEPAMLALVGLAAVSLLFRFVRLKR